MARINRTSVIQKAVNDLAFSVSAEKVIPNETLDKIQLTYDLNNKFVNRVRSITVSTTTNATTIYAVPTNEDFYLTNIYLSNMSDATADNTSVVIQVTTEGITRNIVAFAKLTTTAFSNTVSVDFPYPVKLDRGSNITFICAFTVGASSSRASISGLALSSN